MDHPESKLNQTGLCDGYFVYVYPKEHIKNNDNRRWIGFLIPGEDKSPAKHSHPIPAGSKVGSYLDEEIGIAVQKNPNLTARDIMNGEGLNFTPSSVSEVANDITTIANVVEKHKIDSPGGAKSKNIIRYFDEQVKNKVDEQDSKMAELDEDSRSRDAELLKLCSPYKRLHSSISFFRRILYTYIFAQVSRIWTITGLCSIFHSTWSESNE